MEQLQQSTLSGLGMSRGAVQASGNPDRHETHGCQAPFAEIFRIDRLNLQCGYLEVPVLDPVMQSHVELIHILHRTLRLRQILRTLWTYRSIARCKAVPKPMTIDASHSRKHGCQFSRFCACMNGLN